jgi:hypothetical protein
LNCSTIALTGSSGIADRDDCGCAAANDPIATITARALRHTDPVIVPPNEQRRLDFFISVREVDDQVRDAYEYRGDTAPLDTLRDRILLRMREYGSKEDEYAEANGNPNKAG